MPKISHKLTKSTPKTRYCEYCEDAKPTKGFNKHTTRCQRNRAEELALGAFQHTAISAGGPSQQVMYIRKLILTAPNYISLRIML